ncbi:MAG: iron-sulfur cluster assembly accessory protein [Balneolales bacterium]
MNVIFTEKARLKVEDLLQEEEISAAEVRLISGCAGCGGLSVGLTINDDRKEDDKIIQADGISVFVDENSEPYIGETVVDYEDNDFGGNFIVTNEYGSSVCFV